MSMKKSTICMYKHIQGFSFLSLLLLVFLLASPGFAARITDGVTRHRLQNGLTVLLKEDNSAPVVSIQIWVKAGSANETELEAGITHFIEHMIFKGTKKRGPGEIARAIEAAGGSINAYTSYDRTVYYVEMPREAALLGLDILLDAVQNATFEPVEIQREKEVVLEELRRSLDSPWRRLGLEHNWLSYQGHPYGRPIIGFQHTIKNFNRKMILNYVNKWYCPENMVLVAVGDFDREAFLKETMRLTKDFPKRGAGRAFKKVINPHQSFLRRLLLPESVEQLYLEVSWHIPPARHRHIPALDVLEVILGGGKSSRLPKRLKMDSNLVHTISVASYSMAMAGQFSISATLDPSNLDSTLEAICDELEKLIIKGPTRQELHKAISQVETSFLWGMERMAGQARVLGYFETIEADFKECDRYIEKIRKVSGREIAEVASTYLLPQKLTIGIMHPIKSSPTFGREKLRQMFSLRSPATTGKTPSRSISLGPKTRAKVKKILLSNGMRLVLMEDHRLPLISFTLAFLGGSRLEGPGKWGISEFVSRLLTRGTHKRTALEIAQEIESVSGKLQGFSGRNSFGLKGAFLARDLDLAMELLPDLILNPSFPIREVEKVRQDLLAQIKAKKDRPMAELFDLFYSTLYKNHPYGHPILGKEDTIKAITRAELIQWYKQRARGPNCVLVVVGDFHLEGLASRLATKFRGLSPAGEGLKLLNPEPPLEGIRRIHKKRPGAQTHIVLGYLGVPISSPFNAPMAIVDAALSGQGGRLFVRLRDQMSLAYSVSAFRRPGLETGVFGLYLGCAPQKVDLAIEAMLQEMARLRRHGLSEIELRDAKRYLLGNLAIQSQGISPKAMEMALDELYGLGFDHSERYRKALRDVTLPMVREAISRVISPVRYVLVTLGP